MSAPNVVPLGANAFRNVEIPAGQVVIGHDVKEGRPVTLDLAALLAGRALIQGNSGSGKSWLLRRLFEQAWGKVQQIVFDPEGEFVTLAESFDVLVIDAPRALRAGGGKVATFLRESRASAVLDLSDASSEEQLQLVGDVAAGLVDAPPEHWNPALVLIDEAQSLAPHYDTGDVSPDTRKRAIAALSDLMGRGRKRGLAGVIATQRLAETAKAVVSKPTTVIVGRTIFDRDMQRAGALLGFTLGHSRGLRSLGDGEFMGLGPALVGGRRVRFRAGPVDSPHKGTTPDLEAPPAIAAADAAAMLQALPDAEEPAVQSAPMAAPRRPGGSPGWTAAEEAILRDGYARGLKIGEIAALLEQAGSRPRTRSAISMRGQQLGLRSKSYVARWSPPEDEIVRAAYREGARIADIVRRLEEAGFDRNHHAVQMRAISLGISGDRVNYWTPEEERIALAGLAAGKRHADILADLREAGFDRGLTSINRFAKKHNLQRPHEHPWTDEDIAVLREVYASGGPRVAADRLGRPYSSIIGKASALGISVDRKWPNEDVRVLIEGHTAGRRLIDIAEQLGRPYANVVAMARRMGLRFGPPSTRGGAA